MHKGVTSQDFCQGPGDRYPVATHVHGGLSQAFPGDAGVSIPKIDIQQTVNVVKKIKTKSDNSSVFSYNGTLLCSQITMF